MRTLRNYVLKQLLIPCALSFAIFTFVLIVGNLVRLAELLVNKGVGPMFVIKLFLLQIPSLLCYTLPMAILAGILLAFGRLSSDNEITVMRATGMNLYRLTIPLIIVGLLLSLASVYMNDKILPKTRFASRRLIKEIGLKNPAAYLEEGTFIKAFKSYVVFIYRISRNKLYGIRIYEPQEGKPTRTIVANRGEFLPVEEKNKIRLQLFEGTSDEPDPKDPTSFYKLNFQVYTLTLDLSDKLTGGAGEKKPKEMTFEELKDEMNDLKAKGVDFAPVSTEFHKKVAMSFTPLVFIFIGLPIAVMVRRGEKSVSFGMCLAITILYYLLFVAGEALSLKGAVPPILGTWFPNVVMGILGVALTHRMVKL